ncbi:MAG TPA: type II CAAX endopeptidase family protein [Trueperaceae bacterium]|nr:type II CAAX endopeptidase family protein [Trueperaceae bacterium]
MSLGTVLKQVLRDFAELFESNKARTWFLLSSATVLQAAFWYLATPGPALLRFLPRTLSAAADGISWTVATLLLAPALLQLLTGGNLRDLGLRLGDARFGLRALLVSALVAVPLIALTSGQASGLANMYPWAGPVVGTSVFALLAWALLYSAYYLAFEFFYRGFLLKTFADSFGTTQAIWLQAMAATLIHLGKPLPEALAAFPASLLFGVIAVRSRSILYPAAIHLVVGLTLDIAILARQDLLFQGSLLQGSLFHGLLAQITLLP